MQKEKVKEFLNSKEGIEYQKDKDEADDFVKFAATKSGKAIVKKLTDEIYSLINKLFNEYEDPKLEKLISIIAQLESKVQLLSKFRKSKEIKENIDKILIDMFKD
jgi:hypothetical protein